MTKQLKDLTKSDICDTCAKYSNNFTRDCDKNCPYYMEEGFYYKPIPNHSYEKSHCKTTYDYIKKHPNETVNLDN